MQNPEERDEREQDAAAELEGAPPAESAADPSGEPATPEAPADEPERPAEPEVSADASPAAPEPVSSEAPEPADESENAEAGAAPADAGAPDAADEPPPADTPSPPEGAVGDGPPPDGAVGEGGQPEAAAEGEAEPEEPSLPPQELRAILEALIFASPQPVTARQLGQVLASSTRAEWQAALEELKADYARDGRGLQLVEVAGGWQITTRPEYNDWVRELLDPKTPTRLSIQALETLAVIAYKQPVTQPEVIELRGVKSGGVVKTLLEKRFIRIVGRKEVVGRPMLYGTTKEFLLHFGLRDLGELPRIEEFAEVLGEEVDVAGLKKAIESPLPTEAPLDEAEVTPEGQEGVPEDGAGGPEDSPGENPG